MWKFGPFSSSATDMFRAVADDERGARALRPAGLLRAAPSSVWKFGLFSSSATDMFRAVVVLASGGLWGASLLHEDGFGRFGLRRARFRRSI
eukprot:8935122-Alexandrium_andersonii.AAC.1